MLRTSVLISIIGYFYNIGVFNYSIFGNNELRLYDFGMFFPSIVFLFLLIKGKSIKLNDSERKIGLFVLYWNVNTAIKTSIRTIKNIGIFVVMLLMGLLWGEKRIWLSFLTATLTPLLIFLLFDFVLKIRFPRGILMDMYYG